MIRIPLRNRKGEVRAYALVDDEDANLAEFRWCIADGYAIRWIWRDGRPLRVAMHREVLGLERGNPLHCDHINRDRLDNRRDNLRAVTNGQNSQNVSPFEGKSSRYRGVSWERACNKWRAYARLNGRKHNLGMFEVEEDAAAAASAFRAEHMPFSEDARSAA